MTHPDIYKFNSFTLYIRNMTHYLKSKDKTFTHRYIIEQVGASSSGWFSDLLKGRISLTPLFRLRLSELFELTDAEMEYFENLVNYEQAGTLEEKKIFFERLSRAKEPDAQHLLEHQFDFYRTWYISAIRELLLDYTFTTSSSYKTLAEQLIPTITAEEAEFAIITLLENNLIEIKNNRYSPTSSHIKKSPGFASFYWKVYMESMLNRSVAGLDLPKEIRDISAITCNLSEEQFKEAQQHIAELRKTILNISEKPAKTKRVYQCNIQCLPLSKEF